MRGATRRVVPLAVIFLLALTLSAQVGEKITVNVIEVPVTVVDRDGHPVRGLTAANFTIFDNGSQRPLTGFETIDFAAQETASAIAPINPAGRRSFMLLFDLGFSTPATLARAQEAARRFVRDTVKPRDLVAVGSVSPEHGFRLLTAFTTDRDLTAAAFAEPLSFRGNDPLQLAGATRVFEPTHGDAADATLLTQPKALQAANELQRELAVRFDQSNAQFVRGRIEKEVAALGGLASTLRAVPGRKQIVLLSSGFDPKFVRGRDVREMSGEKRDLASALAGQVWNIDSDARFGNSGSMKLIEEMSKKFRGSDVVLHAIDIEGLRVQNDIAGGRISSDDGLFLLAGPTGGEVFHNSNDLGREFATMLHSQDVVYVLAFQAPASKRGSFHNLEVRLADVPGARASYRSGYYESGGESPMQRTLSNAEVIVNDIPQNDVRVSAVSAAFPDGSDRAQVPVIVEIDGAGLLQDAKGSSAAAEIYIYAFDDTGLVRDRLYQKMTLDLAKLGERLRAGGVKYYGTLNLAPGHYAVKTLVRVAENERRGFVRTDVVVPKHGEMALASYFIDERPADWIMVKGTSHDPAAAYPFAINGEAFVPSASGLARGGERRKLALIVYNAKPDDVAVETSPAAKVLRSVAAGDGTQLVIELVSSYPSLDVSVHKKSAAKSIASARVVLQ